MDRFETITSRDNRRLVAARKVRDGRERERIFIEGKRLVEEALRSNLDVEECFFSTEFSGEQLLNVLTARAGYIAELPDRVFRSVTDTKEPQGILVIARRPATGSDRIELADGVLPLLVYLDRVNNPSNLGAVLRTAEAVGVSGVITSNGCADAFSPRALRAAMGAAFRLPIWDDVDPAQVIDWARRSKLMICAAASTDPRSHTSLDWTIPRMLLLGSEAHGISDAMAKEIDELVGIPMQRGVESLNVAVAAGILLYEAWRQHVSDSS